MNEDAGLSENKVADLLHKLVSIPSSNVDDKKEIVKFVTKNLNNFGYKCRIIGDADAPAILASRGKNGVLLSGHLDTVPIGENWTRDQGTIDGDIFFGRGAADMKGGCTAMLMAAKELAKQNIPLSIAFTTDEETTMKGAEIISGEREVSAAPAIIVCEPTSLTVGVHEKGLLQLRLTTSGTSAHSAMPEEGDNAVHRMISLLDKLRPLTWNQEKTMNRMTLNINTIQGGSKINVIPDSCKAEIDVRTPPKMSPDEALEIVKNRLDNSDCSLELINRLDPISTPMDATIIKFFKKVKKNAIVSEVAYASEMIKFRRINYNVAAYGPGNPRQAHVADEHVDIGEIVDAAGLYIEFAALFR